MPNTKVQLKFPTVQQIWKFARTTNKFNLEINTKELILICYCSAPEVGLAFKEFGPTPVSTKNP